MVPAGTALERSSLAPRGVVSLPVAWKFSPVLGFWNSLSFSMASIMSLLTSMVFMV